MAKRITKSYLKLARSTRFNNDQIHKYRDAQEALDAYLPWLKKRRKLVIKSTKYKRLSKATTTYYKEIRLGSGWKKRNAESKAYILVHEAVHVRQWDHYGRVGFGSRYIFDPRFRWAVEVHGYREGIVWGVVVLKARGFSNEKIRKTLQAKIDQAIKSLTGKTYSLGRVSQSDIKKHTERILKEGIEQQIEKLSVGRPNR